MDKFKRWMIERRFIVGMTACCALSVMAGLLGQGAQSAAFGTGVIVLFALMPDGLE